jgi:uncharacterized flavoprotein (TIGR03862 family)
MTLEAAVVGAGPAGLMAAEVMAEAGLRVTVHDRMPSPARKFLIAGRGGLNLTHSEPLEAFLTRYGDAADWLADPINRLTPSDMRAWADAHGEETFAGSSGRVFPKSFKASPLLRAWLCRLDTLGVTLKTRAHWTGWHDDGALAFAGGSTVKPDVTVLALGGASWPRLGADGGWVDALATRDIAINPLVASNAGVICQWSNITRGRHAGQPLKRIALTCAGKTVRGEAIISIAGLEGGAVYALSRELRAGLAAGNCELALDLRPELSIEQLAQRLARVPRKQSLSNRLRKGAGLKPHEISVWRDFTSAVPDTDEALARSIKHVPISVTGIQPLDRAISTAGGINISEVNSEFMLVKLPGTFVCGEMLDWDAPTGGYLLQACFATGAAAGRGAVQFAQS